MQHGVQRMITGRVGYILHANEITVHGPPSVGVAGLALR